MKEFVVYCLKCREKTNVINPEIIQMNGKGGSKRRAVTGKCSKCGVKICRTIKKEE